MAVTLLAIIKLIEIFNSGNYSGHSVLEIIGDNLKKVPLGERFLEIFDNKMSLEFVIISALRKTILGHYLNVSIPYLSVA